MALSKEEIKIRRKQYRINNQEKIKEQHSQDYLKRKEIVKEKAKQYYYNNKEKVLKNVKEYTNKNKDFKKQYNKEYREKNLEKFKLRDKEYYYLNKDKFRVKRTNYWKNRRHTDIQHKIRKDISTRMSLALRKNKTIKSFKTLELLGCNLETLIKHLESLFKPGMNWNNHGLYGWHIDHIKPCASFNLLEEVQQKQCFHYTNLQPLWAEENIIKSDNIL
jgi:hypothetical protein